MGWQSCPFLVTPKELETVLEPFRLVKENACVPIDYTDTPVGEFLKIYTALFEQLVRGEVIDGKKAGIPPQIAVTTHLSDIKFGMEHEIGGKWVKAVINDKKSILPYLAPFTFGIYTENGKLYVSTRASYLAYRESIFGYEIIFPKFSQRDADYYGLTSEKEFKAYPDYEQFRKNIVRITRPFCFRWNGIVKKTSIRISDEAKVHVPNFNCIRCQDIEIL